MNLKLVAKLAIAGAALVSGAANAQLITNTPKTSGGSDLILFVSDLSNNTFFIQDLGNPLNSIYSSSQVAADGVLVNAGSFSTPTNIAGTDSALVSFLATTGSTDNVQWSILGADYTSTLEGPGQERGLVTSTLDLSGNGGTTQTFTNANTHTLASNMNTFVTWINNNCLTGNTCSSGWGDQVNGIASDGKNAPISWVSTSLANGAAIGTSQTMYLFGTNGAGAAGDANPYVGGVVDVLSNGMITVTNAVPLPAAIWLLGSGLLGLFGIGRRAALRA